jgi:hypothetical protein
MYKKSVTEPLNILSKRLPMPPPMIKQKPANILDERRGLEKTYKRPNNNAIKGTTMRKMCLIELGKVSPALKKAPEFSTLVTVI